MQGYQLAFGTRQILESLAVQYWLAMFFVSFLLYFVYTYMYTYMPWSGGKIITLHDLNLALLRNWSNVVSNLYSINVVIKLVLPDILQNVNHSVAFENLPTTHATWSSLFGIVVVSYVNEIVRFVEKNGGT